MAAVSCGKDQSAQLSSAGGTSGSGSGGTGVSGSSGSGSGGTGASGTSGSGSGGTGATAEDAGRDVAPDHGELDAAVDAAGCRLERSDLERQAVEQHQRWMRERVGGFSNGAISVYRGTAAARDNYASVAATSTEPLVDGVLSGSVIASLAPVPYLYGVAVSGQPHRLTVLSAAQRKMFEVGQGGDAPARGQLYPITDFPGHAGVAGATDEVLPAFAARPNPLAFRAHGEGTWGTGEHLVIDAEVSLTRVAPEAVTYADMEALIEYGTLDGFVSSGPDHVRRVNEDVSAPTCTPPGSGFAANECNYTMVYNITEFIETANIANYGARDLEVERLEFCCGHCDFYINEGACGGGYRRQCFAPE